MKPTRNLTDDQAELALLELERLIRCAKGVSSLAADANVTRQNVYDWIRKGRISATGAATVSDIEKYKQAGFTRQSLCPDVTTWFL